jgi:hypothetical protein
VKGLVYDTGALLAAERDRREVWALHERALARGVRPVVPAVVLAQGWRGGPQVRLSRFLKGCVVEAFAENAARAVGRLLGMAGSADAVDAAVVVSATARDDLVLTTDPDDLTDLAAALGAKLDLHRL